MPSVLESIKSYVGFGSEDAELLRGFLPLAAPHVQRIVDKFYDSIAGDPDAMAVMQGGQEQVKRLKQSLISWLRTGLQGPHDAAYHERRMRIGRQHVRIALPQRYMLTAMNVIRTEFHAVLESTYRDDPASRRPITRALNRLLDMELAIMLETYKEDSEAQLRRKERLASMGQLAGTIGHELRNPLGVIESSLYLVRQHGVHNTKVERHLDKIEAQVHSASEIITDLLDMTRDLPAARERVDLTGLIDKVLAKSLSVPETVVVHRSIDPDVEMLAEETLLARALENVVTNAIHALDGRAGSIWITAESTENGDSLITVRDDGPGFSPEILPRVLEPLVTSRRSGVGLGLALVNNICSRHGGTVEVANHLEGGGLVSLRFPKISR